MMSVQKRVPNQIKNLEDDFVCIQALKAKYDEIDSRLENFIADRFIYLDTKRGKFFDASYSYNALINEYDNHKNGEKNKNEYDHSIKTKSLTRQIWENIDKMTLEDFHAFLESKVKVVLITREENKNKEAQKYEDPIERYKLLGINKIYIRTKKTRWAKVSSFEEYKNNFKEVDVEDFFHKA